MAEDHSFLQLYSIFQNLKHFLKHGILHFFFRQNNTYNVHKNPHLDV